MASEKSRPEERRVSRYHDGEAPPPERAEMERLLAASAASREELGWYRRLGAALRRGAPVRTPAWLTDRIMQRIRNLRTAEHPLVALLPSMMRLAAAAALLTALAIGGFLLQRASHPGTSRKDRETRVVWVGPPSLLTGTELHFRVPDPVKSYQ
jgi:anti-sigma factor RsiW